MTILFLVAAGSFAYFAQRGHLVGEIASFVLLPCALHGVWRGGFRKTAMIAVTLGLLNLFWNKPDFAAPLATAMGAQPGAFSNVASAMLVSGAAYLLTYVIARGLQRRIIARNRFNLAADRCAGALVGGAEGALIVLSLCWMATSLQPYATGLVHSDDTVPGSARDRIGRYLLQVANESDQGPLGAITRSTNPVNHFPDLRNAIDQLNTTGKLNLEGLEPGALGDVRKLFGQPAVPLPESR
jgi:hypothetical protein